MLKMKHNLLLLLVFSLLTLPLQAQRAAETKPQEKSTITLDWPQPFCGVAVKGALKVDFVRLQPGQVCKITYTTSHSPEHRLQAKIDKSGVLRIHERPEKGVVDTTRVTVYYTSLDMVELREAKAHFSSVVEEPMFDLTLLDGARAEAKLLVQDLLLRVEGKSELTLSGEARYMTLKTSGSTRVDAANLRTMASYVKAESKAWVRIEVSERLEAYLSSSKLRYGGNPQWVRGETSFGSLLTSAHLEL